jgi:HEAT repeat protein
MYKAACLLVGALLLAPGIAAGQDNPWVMNDEKSVRILIEYLEKDPATAPAALHHLATLGKRAAPAIPAIKKVLQHDDGHLRIEAARTLLDLEVDTELAIAAIRQATKAKDAEVRAHAVRVIGNIANPPIVFVISCWGPGPRPDRAYPAIGKPAIPELCDALNDPVWKVRAGAAYSLGRIGNQAAPVVPGLVLALKDKESPVAQTAAKALKELGPSAKDAVPALRAIVEKRDRHLELSAVHALFWIDDKVFYQCALPVLLDAVRVKDRSPEELAGFLMTCWVEKGEDAGRVIQGLLRDDDPGTRCVGLRSLKSCPATRKGLIPACSNALRDPHHWVRGSAVSLLSELVEKDDTVLPPLIEALKDVDDRVRRDAVHGLIKAGRKAKNALPILTQLANDPKAEAYTRMAAARSLWHVGADEKTVLALLTPMLRHERYEWRQHAAYSLGDLKEKARPAFAELVDRLKRDEILVCLGAIWAIRQIGPAAVDDAVKELLASLDDADPKVRRTVPMSLGFLDKDGKCVPKVLDRLKSGDRKLRYTYIDCLRQIGPKAKEAVPLLVQLTRDPDADVRRYAREALERIDPKQAETLRSP